QHQPTGGADMGAHREALLHARPTPATILCRVGGGYQRYSLPGPRCLESEDDPKLPPARVRDGLAEAAIPYQLGNPPVFPQAFQIAELVTHPPRQARLMVEVAPLPAHLLVLAGHQAYRLPPPLAALLPTREAFLRFGHGFLGLAVVARVLHRRAFHRDEKDL